MVERQQYYLKIQKPRPNKTYESLPGEYVFNILSFITSVNDTNIPCIIHLIL